MGHRTRIFFTTSNRTMKKHQNQCKLAIKMSKKNFSLTIGTGYGVKIRLQKFRARCMIAFLVEERGY